MATFTLGLMLPSKLEAQPFSLSDQNSSLFLYRERRRPSSARRNRSISPVARLFGPAIFEASKLRVLFFGVDDEIKHPGKLPRTYTLTHSDITSQLTLAVSQTINNSQLQGWSNKLYRDEVVAEWKKIKGKMSLHVHCHISGGHFLLDLCARLRFFIFSKELPVVLKAFVHGDEYLFKNFPELQDSLVWVYFHSNIQEFSKVECWGPLKDAGSPSAGAHIEHKPLLTSNEQVDTPKPCQESCTCCFPRVSLITWTRSVGNVADGIVSFGVEPRSVASDQP